MARPHRVVSRHMHAAASTGLPRRVPRSAPPVSAHLRPHTCPQRSGSATLCHAVAVLLCPLAPPLYMPMAFPPFFRGQHLP
eukprot:39995-Chlamydomonas_euryale.AAC.2